MDVRGAVGQRQLVGVVVLEGFEQSGFGGDDMVELEVVEQHLSGERGTCRPG